MKHLKHLLAALVFVSLIIFTNCGGGSGSGGKVDPLEAQANKLIGTWDLSANGAVGDDGTLGGWESFSLTVTGDEDGGSYTTSGSACDAIFPASGSWEFANANGTVVTRDGDVDISITVTDTQLVMSFTIDSGTCTARTDAANSAAGSYTFTMEN